MIKEKKELNLPLSPKQLLQMKGQAIPLIGYHLIRDHILSTITGEYQSSILYWAGKNLATHFGLQSFEECRNFFLDAGWGLLEKEPHSTSYTHRYTLESPHFQYRQAKENESTFALECGFLAQALAIIEQKDTEGEYKLSSKDYKDSVQIIIYFQDPITKEEQEV